MLRLGCVEIGLHNCVACRQISVQSIEKNEIKFDRNSIHYLASNMYRIGLASFS
jgi:hypothetical protein